MADSIFRTPDRAEVNGNILTIPPHCNRPIHIGFNMFLTVFKTGVETNYNMFQCVHSTTKALFSFRSCIYKFYLFLFIEYRYSFH